MDESPGPIEPWKALGRDLARLRRQVLRCRAVVVGELEEELADFARSLASDSARIDP